MADATKLATAIASGDVSARDVMVASLNRAREVPGAVLRMLADDAAKDLATDAGTGPFSGVPFLGKDLGSSAKGLGVSAGCPALRKRVQDPIADSAVFAGFRKAGLVPFGLTTVPEFGLALTTEPRGAAPAVNPFDASLSAGGSSGGAALAVASGVVAIAHATDAAGSIRVPAACCGLWGLKPSRGSMPVGPEFGNHLMGLASELVLARSLRDVRTAFEAVSVASVPEGETGARRVAMCIPDSCDPSTAASVRDVALALADGGHQVLEHPVPSVLGREADRLARLILTVSLAEWLDAVGLTDADLTPIVAAIAAEGRGISGKDVFAATRDIARITHEASLLFDDFDALLMPVLAGTPPKLGSFPDGEWSPDARFARMAKIAPFASMANACGLPALAFPCGFENRLPIGAQLIGCCGSDRNLLALAGQLAHHVHIPFPAPIAGLPV